MKAARTMAVAVLILASGLAPQAVPAQQTGIKPTDLQRHDLTVPGWEVVQVRVDFAPGAAAPQHSQPGDEIVYVIEGAIEYLFDCRPPLTLGAGGVLFIPAGAIRSAKNVGSGPAAELATYIVERSKPLVDPRRQ